MITIKNNILPFGRYKAMAVWPFIFVRKSANITDTLLQHESIHGRQQIEMLYLSFFLWYGIEYLIRLAQYKTHKDAYRHISFEKEAFSNQRTSDYLSKRPFWEFINYL